MLTYLFTLMLGLGAFAFIVLLGPAIRREIRHQMHRRKRHKRR